MNTEKLLNEKEGKLFAKYTIPSIIAMFGLALYILADTYFIANGIGAVALASLNIVLPVFSLIFALAGLVGIGGATLLSIYRGKGEYHKANRVFSMSMLNAFILSIIFFVLGVFFTEEIARLIGATDITFDYIITYLKVILILSPLMIFNNIIVSFIRNDGKPNLAMIAMVTGTLLNIVLDYIFIYILNLGMFGAALATAGSPTLSLCIVSSHFIRKNNTFKLERFKYSFNMLIKTIECGISSFVAEISGGVVIFLFNFVILKISGELGVAAYGIIANIALVCTAIFNGLAQGMQPIISINFGAEKKSRVRRIFLLGIISALVIGVMFYIIGITFPNQIASLFNRKNDMELLRITITGIKIYFIALIFIGINIITIVFYQSILKAKQSFILSILRGLVLIIVLLFILSSIFGIIGVWLVVPLTEAIIFIICSILTIRYIKNKII